MQETEEVFLLPSNDQSSIDHQNASNYQRTNNPRTQFGSVLEQESQDHYLNSQMDNKRSLMGLIMRSLERPIKVIPE